MMLIDEYAHLQDAITKIELVDANNAAREWIDELVYIVASGIQLSEIRDMRKHVQKHGSIGECLNSLQRESDLTDEACAAVERLRAVSHESVMRSSNHALAALYELCDAVGANRGMTYTGMLDAIRERIIELIEHGGKQDVDVSALRELADKMSAKKGDVLNENTSKSFRSGAIYGIDDAPERIRKAVEGAPKPDAESDSERACAALLDWRDQVAGLLGIDCGSMADEVQDAIMAELDKRLMPPGMEWPKFEDGERVDIGDEFAWAGNAYECDAVKLGDGFALHCDEAPSSWYGYSFTDSVKRPEPEVLGADGLPIKVGETVYTPAGTKMTVRNITGDMVSAGIQTSDRAHAHILARFLTHTTPDTNERIDKDASMPPRRYYADKIGHDVGLKDDEEVFAAVALDLLRRQRELDAKTMGGDAE